MSRGWVLATYFSDRIGCQDNDLYDGGYYYAELSKDPYSKPLDFSALGHLRFGHKMRITYKGNDYNYYVDISDNNGAFTANDEALMNRLEKEIFGQEISDIIKKYYSDTYEYAFNRGEKPSKDLERKFVAWQQKFKTYLRLRFKKINQEILKQQSYKQTISWLKKMKYLLTTSPNGSTRKHK